MRILKHGFILVVFLLILGACGTAEETSDVGSDNSIEIIAASYKEESDLQSQALNVFIEEVEKLSDGEIKIEVYHNAELGNEVEQTEKMINGSIDIGEIGSSGLDQFGMNATPIPELPYLFDDYESFTEILNNEDVKNLIEKNVEKEGLKLLGFRMAAASHILATEPLYEFEDYKGLKLRSPEFKITEEFLKAWGARPTVIPFPDIYSSLQNGVVMGYTAVPSVILSNNTYEMAKYLNMTNHMYTPQYLVMNKASFDSLSADQQDIIEEAAKKSEEYFNNEAYSGYVSDLKELEELGVELIEYEDLTPFQEAVKDLNQELAESMGSDAVELYETIIGTE